MRTCKQCGKTWVSEKISYACPCLIGRTVMERYTPFWYMLTGRGKRYKYKRRVIAGVWYEKGYYCFEDERLPHWVSGKLIHEPGVQYILVAEGEE